MDREQIFHELTMMVLDKRVGELSPELAVETYFSVNAAIKEHYIKCQPASRKKSPTSKMISPGIKFDL